MANVAKFTVKNEEGDILKEYQRRHQAVAFVNREIAGGDPTFTTLTVFDIAGEVIHQQSRKDEMPTPTDEQVNDILEELDSDLDAADSSEEIAEESDSADDSASAESDAESGQESDSETDSAATDSDKESASNGSNSRAPYKLAPRNENGAREAEMGGKFVLATYGDDGESPYAKRADVVLRNLLGIKWVVMWDICGIKGTKQAKQVLADIREGKITVAEILARIPENDSDDSDDPGVNQADAFTSKPSDSDSETVSA